MEVSVRNEGRLCIAAVRDARIDAQVALSFKDAMRDAAKGGSGPVLLDLSSVDFVDSSGLGAIVATMKHLGEERPLVLAGLTPQVERVFRLTRMNEVFDLQPSIQTAMEAYQDD